MAEGAFLDELVQLISNTTDAFTTALFFRHPDKEIYRLASYYSLSKHVDPDFSFAEGEGFWGWVAKHGKPLNISPFNPEYKPLDIYRSKEEIKSFLAVPLAHKSGVLSVDSKATYVFTDRVTKLLQEFGRMALRLRWLDRHLEDLEKERILFQFIAEMERRLVSPVRGQVMGQVLERCRDLLGAETVFWARFMPQEQGYLVQEVQGPLEGHPFLERNFSPDQGLVGLVLRKREPLFLERVHMDSPKSFLFHSREPSFKVGAFAGLPVVAGERVMGVLGLVFPEARVLSREEKECLLMLSSILASRV